ncbi:MAG: STAS domain-containing protein [Verrucomicrobia bacterium]|nr:STAS domain-containing protein [Verrucomicrobiota bacterium]
MGLPPVADIFLPMQIAESIDGQITILTVTGEVDLNQSPNLRVALRAKAQAKTPRLILDFTAVAYIDSSGLATLIEYYQNARTYSGHFAICSLTPRVRSSFDLVRLSEVFSIFPDQAEARKALAGGSA